MSAPRCIRLAIRTCKTAKIPNSAPRCQRRFLATTQACREEKARDIKAGFPSVPAPEDDSHVKSTQPEARETPTKKDPISSNAAPPDTTVTVTRGEDNSYSAGGADSHARQIQLHYPSQTSRIRKKQIQELLAGYDVEEIWQPGKFQALVILKTTEDAKRAVTEVTGRRLPESREPPEPKKTPPTKKPKAASQVNQQPTPESQSQPSAAVQATPQPQKSRTEQPKKAPTEKATTASQPAPKTAEPGPRLPLNVVAAYHKPLRLTPTHNVRVASLQLRSYSVRNLEFMCDFAMRAAYYLGLPASGPVPLPKRIERWTMPRSNFAHKKSQENFERITRRRAIQIFDGHKDVVQVWLAYLRKHQFYGVGMKADVWEFEGMDVAASMDAQFQQVERELDEKLSLFGWNKQVAGERSLTEQLRDMGPGQQTGVTMMHVRDGSRSESRL